MTVANGRDFLAIPGPTVIPDRVLSAMHRPAIDIYSGSLVATTDSCLSDLKKIFRTSGDTYIYAANGHGAWEASLSNTLSKGDRILVLESGRFAHNWGEMGVLPGLEISTLEGDWRRAVDADKFEQMLREDRDHQIAAVLVVQVDTASGVVNDIPRLRAAMNAAGHPALLMVDCIASLATMPFKMDEWGVDLAITGSQKGLMMPPGLSFVAAGERAKLAHEKAGLRTRYWDWTMRDGPEHYMKYCGTPPEHMLFGLRCALDMILEEGLSQAIKRHQLLAGAVRSAVAAWATGGALEFNILEASERADSVTTIAVNHGDPAVLLDWCEQQCGVKLGITIGDLYGKGFRIAHMGHVNAPMVLGTLGVVETGFKALGWSHGEGGVQAAIEHLGTRLSA
jgi:alanine-glyoxylate transaminase/serine-glyoxylate transaminase/serine-pyruvate transaminase